MADKIIRALDAQALQDAHPNMIWVVTRPNRHFVALPHMSDLHGGDILDVILVARTLEELRRQLPRGLTHLERAAFWAEETVEMWGG